MSPPSTSDLISIVSVVIAALALYVSWRNQRRITAIEEARERDRLMEQKRAALTARLAVGSYDEGSFLWIENHGRAEARDIRVTLAGRPVMEVEEILPGQEEIRTLGGRSAAAYRIVMHDAFPLQVPVEVAWSDDSGEPGLFRSTLTR
jgi:hypothetical protein